MKKSKSSQIHEGSKRKLKIRKRKLWKQEGGLNYLSPQRHSVIGEGFLGGTFKTWVR